MSDSRGDLKFIRESSIMYDLAEISLVKFLDDVYNLDGDTIILFVRLDIISVYRLFGGIRVSVYSCNVSHFSWREY